MEPENILYACGIEPIHPPKSIAAKAVFARCERIVPNFKESERKFCMMLAERRNADLHSGELAFEALGTDKWQTQYYQVCKLLLDCLEKSIEDFVGPDEAPAIEKMLKGAEQKVIGVVKKAILLAERAFKELSKKDQEKRVELGKAYSGKVGPKLGRTVSCPSCPSPGLIEGEMIRSTAPKIEDDLILRDLILLPIRYACVSCGLKLDGFGQLNAAGLGGQYSLTVHMSIDEYYGKYFEDPGDYENE